MKFDDRHIARRDRVDKDNLERLDGIHQQLRERMKQEHMRVVAEKILNKFTGPTD